MFDYLGTALSSANAPAMVSGPGFLQNFAGAMGRSAAFGGGAPGLFAALAPETSGAVRNAQAGATAPGSMAWPSQSPNSGGGLKF